MRSSITKNRWLENSSSEILQELQSEFQSDKQLISPIPLWSPRWHEATKLIYDYHMKSSWGVLPGCYAQRSICVPSAALWAFLLKIVQKITSKWNKTSEFCEKEMKHFTFFKNSWHRVWRKYEYIFWNQDLLRTEISPSHYFLEFSRIIHLDRYLDFSNFHNFYNWTYRNNYRNS